MHRVLPHFRPPKILNVINRFLRPHPTKAAVLRMLANGLHGRLYNIVGTKKKRVGRSVGGKKKAPTQKKKMRAQEKNKKNK